MTLVGHLKTSQFINMGLLSFAIHFHPRPHFPNFPRWTSPTCAVEDNILTYDRNEKDIDVASVGNLCVDIILPISQYPIVLGEHQRLTTGARLELGGSMNALISAMRLGAKVAPIAFITTDDAHHSDALVSAFVQDSSRRLGIYSAGLVPQAGATIPTCAAIFDPNGEHTFLASNELPEDDVTAPQLEASDSMLDTVARSKSLIVDGYAFHSDRTLVSDSVRTALSHGTHIWLDPQAATASLLRTGDKLFEFIMTNTYGVSITTAEALLVTDTTNPSDAIRILGKECCPSAMIILLKDGASGSHIAWRNKEYDPFEVHTISSFYIPDENFRDPIGAGDSFLGAFLAGRLSLGYSIEKSGIIANAMGASTCMNHGAGESGIGTIATVEQFLAGCEDFDMKISAMKWPKACS